MFSIKNISSGMWKLIIIVSIFIFSGIYITNGKPTYYTYAILGIGIIILFLGSSYNQEFVEKRPEIEARKISDEYLKKKIEMQIGDFNIQLPEGILNYDGCHLHDEIEGVFTPVWEIGFHIHPRFQSFPEYYSLLVHGLREPLTIKGIRKHKEPYFAQPFKTKFILVDVTDAKKYHWASLLVYNHNREEGFET